MKLRLRYYGDPVLRIPARPVEYVDDPYRELARNMLETMAAEAGIGLAAQQVGETVSLCVVDVPAASDVDPSGAPLNPSVSMPLVLFNPRIDAASERQESCEEGCLSFPDISTPVQRASEIDLTYMDKEGKAGSVHLRGLAARAVQHEMDHLAGRLIVDHMTPVKRVAFSGRLKRLRRRTRADL